MYRVAVVLVPGVYLYSIGGILDAFQIANDHIRSQLGDTAKGFDCCTVAQTDQPVAASCGMRLTADCMLDQAGAFDLVYVPALHYQGLAAYEALSAQLGPTLTWLAGRWQAGSMIAANCTGTLLLAETGLLTHRAATTAWWLEKTFRRRFPKVRLDTNVVLEEDDRLMTTGAMTANLNMAMHLVGRYAGPHLAAVCAKTMLIDTGTRTQLPYQDLMQSALSHDPVVAKAQYWMQNHLGETFDQASLAKRVNVSKRTLIRRFQTALGQPPLTYLQNLRIEAAKRLLEDKSESLPDIVARVGYVDVSSFSRMFKSKTGLTPYGYRQRFSQDGPAAARTERPSLAEE